MIKNLNDLVSFVVLILVFLSSIRIFAWAFFARERITTKINRWQLLKDYIDNEEE